MITCTPTTADVDPANSYTIEVIPKDPWFAENGYLTLNYHMNILANRAPVYNTSETIAPLEYKAGESFTITFSADMFYEPEGEPITYTFDGNGVDVTSWLSLDSATRTFTANPVPNGDVGDYTINIIANDDHPSSLEASYGFSLKITENEAPTVVTPASDSPPACVKAHYAFEYAVAKSNYNEPEGETMSYSFTVSSGTLGSWVSMTENTTHLIFSGTPANTQVGTFTVTIEIDDIHSLTAATTDSFDV